MRFWLWYTGWSFTETLRSPDKLLLILPAMVLFISVALDYIAYGCHFVQRAGSVLVLFAILIEARAFISLFTATSFASERVFARLMEQILGSRSHSEFPVKNDPPSLKEIQGCENLLDWSSEEAGSIAKEAEDKFYWRSRVALILAVLGTALWGYADLIIAALFGPPSKGCFT